MNAFMKSSTSSVMMQLYWKVSFILGIKGCSLGCTLSSSITRQCNGKIKMRQKVLFRFKILRLLLQPKLLNSQLNQSVSPLTLVGLEENIEIPNICIVYGSVLISLNCNGPLIRESTQYRFEGMFKFKSGRQDINQSEFTKLHNSYREEDSKILRNMLEVINVAMDVDTTCAVIFTLLNS